MRSCLVYHLFIKSGCAGGKLNTVLIMNKQGVIARCHSYADEQET